MIHKLSSLRLKEESHGMRPNALSLLIKSGEGGDTLEFDDATGVVYLKHPTRKTKGFHITMCGWVEFLGAEEPKKAAAK